jgi:heat shock protein HslJ
MRHLILGSLCLSIVLAACSGAAPSDPATTPAESPDASGAAGSAAPPSGSEPSGAMDPNGDWRLVEGTVSGTPIPLLDDHPVTLTIDGTQISGTSACNGYGGEIVVEGGEVRFGEVGGTMMLCEEPVMAVETAYTAALPTIRQATMEGEQLVLVGDGVSLRFEPIPPVPTAELVDTMWALSTLIDGDTASSVAGEPATLRIAGDLSFEGSTGCRSFTGRFVEAGGELVATDMAMTDQACPAELADQDSHVTGVLGDGFRAQIDGDRLTLTAAGGQGLGYTVE